MDCKQRLREFLGRFFKDYDLKDDEDIFALGYVNSLLAMQLVMFVQRELGVSVNDDDLDIANFRSVNAICAFVQRRSAA